MSRYTNCHGKNPLVRIDSVVACWAPPFSFEMLNALNPIFKIGKSTGVYHQFCGEVLEAFEAHTRDIQLGEILKIPGTGKAETVLIFAEYDRVGASICHVSADNPDGNISVFGACFFFGHFAPLAVDW
ncbi:YhbY family RNA-binding protein [Desulfopila sp. IMCC35006]|uniref:YhbY family RNA-binding protein n=1 Tax=Desulfopila sp. IMCC35006 TaxID=2569542 RepID=UPI0010AD3F31|nr:YhbY family RNA-binding protein [Desulfopila sp. IMCC35006]TKB27111.1 YhbY family RNA-binding protein [Desulfopila sp. IMCC35006]